ncbi:hypothetical protein BH10PSE12_BH10PSE12_24910 [soil metagenome]
MRNMWLLISATGLLGVALPLNPAQAQAQTQASVVMTGTGNAARMDQAGALDARVDVSQIGDFNSVNIVQDGNAHSLTASQQGAGNQGNYQQSGDGLAQMTHDVTGSDNGLIALQTADVGGEAMAVVMQDGAGNQAVLEQATWAGAANDIRLVQNGNDNLASLFQAGADNSLALNQAGDHNLAAITQIGTSLAIALEQHGGGTIVVTQTGP